MNSTTSLQMNVSSQALNDELNSPVSLFQWLLILGFPPSVAAAKAMPEIFRVDDASAPDISLFPAFRTAA